MTIEQISEAISPVYPKKVPTNRRKRRELFKELTKNSEELRSFEINFLDALFDEDGLFNNYDYNDLYKHFLNEYTNSINKMIEFNRFKVTIPNKKYFSQIFKPVI